MRSPKRARARHVSRPQAVTTPSKCPRKVAIGNLSDEVLLNIFRCYLDTSPQFWPRLVHICRKWRRIVFASQQALHLRLFCTHGTPVLKTLSCWPALPIVVRYGGAPALDPPAPEDEDDIMAALKHSDRVSSISLTVTSSLLEKLSAIERPFSELEDLDLLSRDSMWLTMPSTFRWGPRLRTLHMTKIAIPALTRRLSPSADLVSLQLHNVDVGYFPPDALADALSALTQLETLSLHFISITPFRYDLVFLPRSRERVILSALTCLKYRGTGEYLDHFVSRIDAPRLGDIDITFFSPPTMNDSQLGRFIDRIEMQNSHCRAEILSSERAISISFTQPEAPTRLELQVSFEPFSRQLSCMAQICNGLSALLLGVEHLRISTTQLSSWWDYREPLEWLKLMRSFRGTKRVHVAGDHSMSFMFALHSSWREREAVLPALYKLCVRGPWQPHARLQEAVKSFIHSRWLSGHIMVGVVYEREQINKLLGTGPFFQQVTVEMLPDDVLLNIFRLYLDFSPQLWPTLTHVSRRWRNIVYTSPLGLDLRLYCTHRTPVSKTLDCWPALPIVVQYGGEALDSPDPEDEDNIVAALKHYDRVSSIDLMITSPLLQKLFAIAMPFSELEELVLRSLDNVQLTLPSTLRWGTRLRRLHSTRVTFPVLLALLSPSTGLVDLQLHEISNVGYFSPEAFADALSEMVQLETLSLHFLSFPSRRIHLGLPPQSGERVILPALTCLKYRGINKYLDSFVARIDAPRLGDIDVTFFSQPTMDASQLGRFIERIETQTSLSQAEIQFSELAISISFTQPSGPTRLELRIPCEQLDWQLSSIAQICDHFSPFIFRVEDLRIKAIQLPSRQDVIDHEQWLKLIHSFRGVKDFYVDDKLLSDVLIDLDLANGKQSIFPRLRTLRLLQLQPRLGSFTTLPLLASRRIPIYDQSGRSCKICLASFTEQQELKKHLVVMHAYRLVCPYCREFEFSPRYSDLFREHLASKHADVIHTDTLVLNSASQSSSPSYSSSQVTRNNDLRASVNFGAFTQFKAPNIALHESPTDIQTQLDTVIHFLTPPYPSWLPEDA